VCWLRSWYVLSFIPRFSFSFSFLFLFLCSLGSGISLGFVGGGWAAWGQLGHQGHGGGEHRGLRKWADGLVECRRRDERRGIGRLELWLLLRMLVRLVSLALIHVDCFLPVTAVGVLGGKTTITGRRMMLGEQDS